MVRRRRAHPLTPRQRAAWDELIAWGERKIELDRDQVLHKEALVPIVRNALEVGLNMGEIADRLRIARATLYRWLDWDETKE